MFYLKENLATLYDHYLTDKIIDFKKFDYDDDEVLLHKVLNSIVNKKPIPLIICKVYSIEGVERERIKFVKYGKIISVILYIISNISLFEKQIPNLREFYSYELIMFCCNEIDVNDYEYLLGVK